VLMKPLPLPFTNEISILDLQYCTSVGIHPPIHMSFSGRWKQDNPAMPLSYTLCGPEESSLIPILSALSKTKTSMHNQIILHSTVLADALGSPPFRIDGEKETLPSRAGLYVLYSTVTRM
jgi:hypothetical protein